MPSPNLVRVLSRSWRFLALAGLVGAALALGFSLIQPLRYSSSVRLLITQTNVTGLDPYTAVKSTERIAQNLSEVVFTSSFFKAVSMGEGIDVSYFPKDEISKRKAWRESVETAVHPGTGIMTITAYHPSRDQANRLAVKIAEEIVNQTPNYFGYSVRVQIIDDPLPSRFFAKPDFLRNGLLGVLVGVLAATAWVLGRVREGI